MVLESLVEQMRGQLTRTHALENELRVRFRLGSG
jgi:hypothetical protein